MGNRCPDRKMDECPKLSIARSLTIKMSAESTNKIPNFLSLKELALYFSISERATRRLVDSRRIAFYKIGGCLRFKREDVFNFLENNRIDQLTQ